MRITGGCHCGNIGLELDWPDGQLPIRSRACDCGFCTRHGAVWTSSPSASLTVSIGDSAHVVDYRFGSGTAVFRVCTHCGVVPCVTSTIDGVEYAVVNVNTLVDLRPSQVERATVSFEGENLGARLARRKRYWIGNVRVLPSDAQPSARGP